jgi:hypothetical protein
MKSIYCYKNDYGGKIKLDDGAIRAIKDDTIDISVEGNTVNFNGSVVTVPIVVGTDEVEFDDAPGTKFGGTAIQLQDKLMEYFFGNANSSSGGSGGILKEVVPFTGVSELDIPWNSTRISRFGDSGIFYVEVLGDDDQYHYQLVEGIADDIENTTNYHFDFGAIVSGRITII